MSEKINSNDINVKEIIGGVISAVENNSGWLSEIDGAIGDGDHGVNMSKGFRMVRDKIGDYSGSLSEALKMSGMTLMENIGGAMGPIYGTFFIRMGKAVKDKEIIEGSDILNMLDSALEGVKKRGGAEAGDKTLVDALEPAKKAYETAFKKGAGVRESIENMIEGAKTGMEYTKELVAKKGRSSRLGERSKGTIDAGSASCYIILKSLFESLMQYLA
jgi:dihydroxyacetone kinase-like protein